MTKFNPKYVDRSMLKMMRTARRGDFVYAAWMVAAAISMGLLGFSPILVWLFSFFAVGNAVIGVIHTMRINKVEIEQAKTPQVWPPDVHQCPICRSYAVDAIEYASSGWQEFFGYKAHGYCKEYVWPLWSPREIGR